MGNQKELFSVEALAAWYVKDQLVLKDVHFSLNKNENLALVGANGSGKTTLIKTLMDIHPDYQVERVTYEGERTTFSDQAFKLNRMMVFSEDASFKYWTFSEFVHFLHTAYHRTLDQSYVDYMIEGFHFQDHYQKPMKDLSMGNKKKFFITAALSLKLPMVFLDEPVDGLDFESTAFLYKILREYKAFGSVFMSSHILESINECCDSLVLLQEGRLTEKIPLDQALSMEDIMAIFERGHRD